MKRRVIDFTAPEWANMTPTPSERHGGAWTRRLAKVEVTEADALANLARALREVEAAEERVGDCRKVLALVQSVDR